MNGTHSSPTTPTAATTSHASPTSANKRHKPNPTSPATPQRNGHNRHGAASNGSARSISNGHHQPQPSAALQQQRQQLPIYAARDQLLQYIDKHPTVIILSPTGSGKSTQLPQYLYEHYNRSLQQHQYTVCCTQPRRVAAINVATRVAEEVGCKVASTVGYTIRFEDRTSASTRIKYVTDGMLLREIQSDQLLKRYNVVIIDEAHERSVESDICIALLKRIQHERHSHARLPPLKLIAMSATLATETFSTYLNDAPILHIDGRQYPVQIYYTPKPVTDYHHAVVNLCVQLHIEKYMSESSDGEQRMGDMLVFLTGSEEIESIAKLLKKRKELLPPVIPAFEVLPLYSQLAGDDQQAVFAKHTQQTRRIILATNIAETSVTIDNIKYVVDCGMVKRRHYNPQTFVDVLRIEPISKTECWQRSGRAGRQMPGECFRLFTEDDYETKLSLNTTPEIQSTNLCSVLLQLLILNINPFTFDWLTAPSQQSIATALQQLVELNAVLPRPKAEPKAEQQQNGSAVPDFDAARQITELGRMLNHLPLPPQYAKILIMSCHDTYACSEEMLTIVSCISVESPMFTNNSKSGEHGEHASNNNKRNAFTSIYGDHLTYLNVYNQYQKHRTEVKNDFKQLRQWCNECGIQHRTLSKIDQIRKQLKQVLTERLQLKLVSVDDGNSNSEGHYEKLRKCLLTGLYAHTAKRIVSEEGGSTRNEYLTLLGKNKCAVHPSSVLTQRLYQHSHTKNNHTAAAALNVYAHTVVYTELVASTNVYMRDCTVVDGKWLHEVMPNKFSIVADQ